MDGNPLKPPDNAKKQADLYWTMFENRSMNKNIKCSQTMTKNCLHQIYTIFGIEP